MVRSCPSPVERAQHSVTQLFHFPDVLGKPASLIGSELSSLLGSGPSLFPTPIRHAATKTTRVGVILRGVLAPNQKSAMDDKERQIDEMGEAREAQYALECVLVRLTEAELQRVIDDLPPRAREHIRATTAHKIRHLGE